VYGHFDLLSFAGHFDLLVGPRALDSLFLFVFGGYTRELPKLRDQFISYRFSSWWDWDCPKGPMLSPQNLVSIVTHRITLRRM
jgi:hypothetical protein